MRALRLVFDLDDTLYPERQFAISGFQACERWLIHQHGVGQDIAQEMLRALDDGLMRHLFDAALYRHLPDRTPEQLSSFIEIYRLHQPNIQLYDDADQILARYRADGCTMGLITDGQDDVQSSKVRALGVEAYFAHIIYTHALGGRAFSKPNPKAFQVMEHSLGRPGDQFVYVGDNPAKDFVAPNQMGWITVQVDRENRIHAGAQTAEGGEPQHMIDTLADLPAVLEQAAPGHRAS